MDAQILQTLAVAGSLAGAALYLGRRALTALGVGRRGKKDGCGGGCGCSHG
jgi:hypothetical protein